MARPMGVAKRPPSYVPSGPLRDFLMSLSKADLAEMVYDYAVRTVGEEDAAQYPDLLVHEMLVTHEAVVYALSRRPRPRPRAGEGG